MIRRLILVVALVGAAISGTLGCSSTTRLNGRDFVSLEQMRGETRLPPHRAWIGNNSATAGVVRAEGDNNAFTSDSFFVEGEHYKKDGNDNGKKRGVGILAEGFDGHSPVYDYHGRQAGLAYVDMDESYTMLDGSQTKKRGGVALRHDWGRSRLSSYEAEEDSWLLLGSLSKVLYRNPAFYSYLNKVELYARGALDVSDKKSSEIGGVRSTWPDPPNNHSYVVAGINADVYRVQYGSRDYWDIALKGALEIDHSAEFNAESIRPGIGVSVLGGHITLMYWNRHFLRDQGKKDVEDSEGFSVWATVFSW